MVKLCWVILARSPTQSDDLISSRIRTFLDNIDGPKVVKSITHYAVHGSSWSTSDNSQINTAIQTYDLYTKTEYATTCIVILARPQPSLLSSQCPQSLRQRSDGPATLKCCRANGAPSYGTVIGGSGLGDVGISNGPHMSPRI
ncbi:hypothetical protein EV421DRAFT_1738304 [Armillaria borealis]|uniref:Uncharacterized protein n=1 Tax=Armillaria borealis TaxID=47425 RepID=A0AA39MLM2_9AGAR|nr:hypothetical protein EV421DRAFT_1738304 [Armillaria borealis]